MLSCLCKVTQLLFCSEDLSTHLNLNPIFLFFPCRYSALNLRFFNSSVTGLFKIFFFFILIIKMARSFLLDFIFRYLKKNVKKY